MAVGTMAPADEGYREIALARKRTMERLLKRHRGTIKPEDVLKEARDPDSALHELFEWDDGEAAERYRLIQAAHFIRRYRVYITPHKPGEIVTRTRIGILPPIGDDNSRTTPRVVHVNGAYRELGAVLNDTELTAALMAQATAELRATRRRYAALTGLVDVWRAIDALPVSKAA